VNPLERRTQWARITATNASGPVRISAIMIDQFGNVITVIGIHDQ